ncbi:MAG: hypothetical protein FWB98_03450 [Defluviitaleaceae bacterium]|nr:hypothetical protein [Defluviitaleaceae bacterium]
MNNYLALVEEKSTILEKILNLTKEYKFTGEQGAAEQEAEAFSELYTRRENIFDRAKRLDEALKAADPLSSSEEEKKTIEGLISKQNQMVKEILAFDEANMKMYEVFKAHLVGNLKGVVQTKHINEKYMDDYELSGHFFDKKN